MLVNSLKQNLFLISESKRAKLDFDEPVARVAFATWLRRQNACNSGVVASNLNPSSRLYQATSTKEGVKFLNQKLRWIDLLIDLLIVY